MKTSLSSKLFNILAISLILVLVITACTSTQTPAENTSLKVKIGASPVPHSEILAYVRDNLAAAAGLEIEIVEFTDYVQPNLALNDGQLDANSSSTCLIWKTLMLKGGPIWFRLPVFTLSLWNLLQNSHQSGRRT